MSTRLRPMAISIVAALIAVMNLVYAAGIFGQLLESGQDAAFSQVAISAISAQAGIVIILAWVLADPVARRGALLAMVAPMLLGNVLYGMHMHYYADVGVMRLAANAMVAVLCSIGVYWAYRLASPKPNPAGSRKVVPSSRLPRCGCEMERADCQPGTSGHSDRVN
jgi:hypothetical protein